MKQKKCLIAGLPESGKSTYLGALWHTINYHQNKDGMALKAATNNPPADVQQLMALSTKWLNVEDMDRTYGDVPESISFNLTDGVEEYALEVPDFRGESIRQIVTLNQPKSFNEWIEKGDTLLYMISDIDAGVFADDYQEDEEEDDAVSDEIPEFDIKKTTPAALNMLILRYLAEKCTFRKVVICLSAWDEVVKDGETVKPETYLKEQSPALYNFIKYHFRDVSYYGLSAQGEAYEYESFTDEDGNEQQKVTAACKARLQAKTVKGERAFVVSEEEPEPNYDITLPIATLLK